MNTTIKDGRFTISFPNIEQFYKESDTIEPTGDINEWTKNNEISNPYWIGLSREEIIKSKFCYKEGLDKLKSIEQDFNLGGSKRIYKWDENDGDDMNYDRFLDNLPCLNKRTIKKGDGKGKIITIYVSIGENCNVKYQEMLNRSYTVMRLVDYLENLNYRTEIIAYIDVKRLGEYKEERIETLHTEIILKRAEDPLIKGLILNCISPWMLRCHMFKLWSAKFKVYPSYGSSYSPVYTNTNNKIYFRTGECLTKNSCEAYLKELAEKFDFNE